MKLTRRLLKERGHFRVRKEKKWLNLIETEIVYNECIIKICVVAKKKHKDKNRFGIEHITSTIAFLLFD